MGVRGAMDGGHIIRQGVEGRINLIAVITSVQLSKNFLFTELKLKLHGFH